MSVLGVRYLTLYLEPWRVQGFCIWFGTYFNFERAEMEHKYYNLGVQAFSGTSFSPEKRAESRCRDHDEEIREFTEWLNDLDTDMDKEAELERYTANIDKAFSAYLGAHSRVMSTMITGPANFPTGTNRKRGDTADRRMGEYLECTQKAKQSINKRVNKERIEKAGGEIGVARTKLEKLKKWHELMKTANKIIRMKPKGESTKEKVKLLMDAGLSDALVLKLFVPDFGSTGFQGFYLTNSNATIKRTAQRIRELERKEEAETTEREINGIKIIENAEADRMQLVFDGKPADEIRQELKHNGFRWSPRAGAWQRKLTNNARYTVKKQLSFLQQ